VTAVASTCARPLQLCLDRLDAQLLLAQGARVQHRRQRWRQRRDDGIRRHRVSLAQRDAREHARERRRDHVALAQASLAVLVDRGLERAAARGRDLDFDGPRRERPGEQRCAGDRERDESDGGTALHLSLES
jgi:hypothetical protein